MKLLFLLKNNIYAETSAGSNRWRTFVEGLSNFDVEIVLLFTSGYRTKEEKRRYRRKGLINKKISYVYGSFESSTNIWMRRINVYILSRFFLYFNIISFKMIVENFKPEVIVINPCLEVFSLINRVYPKSHEGFKMLMEINEFNDVFDIHTTNRLQKLNNSRFNYYLSKCIFPQLDLCLVITETLKNHYSLFPGINPSISFLKVPVTVDLDRFKKQLPNNNFQKPYIAYCGSSSFHIDGVDILIKSFARIAEFYPKLKLYIAAYWENDGPKMMKLIRDTNLPGRIIYLGTLERDEIPSLIQNARVLALARPDSRQSRGAFPTKIGEYLATGNAVCVTKVGEIPSYLVDNESAFFANPGEIDSFVDALIRALSDNILSKEVGKNGKKIAEKHFSMEVQAKNVYDFIHENL
jgi:glycosyltransferase involved in cell wall biosynthesis